MFTSRKRRVAVGLSVLAVAAVAVVASVGVGGAAARTAKPATAAAGLPRDTTLYTTGTQWGTYSDLNPFKTWDYVTGLVGLVYEPMFNYNPLKDKYTPWLATKGSWIQKNVYRATIRTGVTWSDGKPLTPADVKFTFETGKIATATFHQLWTSGLKSITTKGNDVTFTFSTTPNYQEFNGYLYNIAIVPQHVWKRYTPDQITSGNLASTKQMVGTGPYTYGSGLNSKQSFTWKKRSGWWATGVYGLNPKPQYIVDIFNGSNNASLANLLAGNIDLSNNFVPGINTKVGSKITTYYPSAPYMLSGNTAWLVPNLTRAPLSDVQFRHALAASIDVNKIVEADYGHIVSPANPTGLLPVWKKYIDNSMVQKYGFTFDVSKAKSILAAAGYKDTNGDGYVENKDGSTLNLSLIVPNGWSDWMTAIQIIADSAKAAGIKITPTYPDYNTLVDDRGHGNYDLVINNDQQIGNTPWTYYNYMFRLPLSDNQTTVNYERYNNPAAWALTQQLDKVNTVPAMQKITSQLQSIFLQDLPLIPLWYNGVWAQANTGHWKSWPTVSSSKLQTLPAMWRGYLQMGGINMISNLQPGK